MTGPRAAVTTAATTAAVSVTVHAVVTGAVTTEEIAGSRVAAMIAVRGPGTTTRAVRTAGTVASAATGTCGVVRAGDRRATADGTIGAPVGVSARTAIVGTAGPTGPATIGAASTSAAARNAEAVPVGRDAAGTVTGETRRTAGVTGMPGTGTPPAVVASPGRMRAATVAAARTTVADTSPATTVVPLRARDGGTRTTAEAAAAAGTVSRRGTTGAGRTATPVGAIAVASSARTTARTGAVSTTPARGSWPRRSMRTSRVGSSTARCTTSSRPLSPATRNECPSTS